MQVELTVNMCMTVHHKQNGIVYVLCLSVRHARVPESHRESELNVWCIISEKNNVTISSRCFYTHEGRELVTGDEVRNGIE